ncbi:hypothetical protein COLO4_24664 [Corchorus olitorius]|uniref:Uncharacterized protein n=1 Tax=Corchorus olitorius TaxID=93759 RepID=A0A1R3I8I5_9ROSI|nr:hypothetical protein COLO4_24664 [Corchorus olitorius]
MADEGISKEGTDKRKQQIRSQPSIYVCLKVKLKVI